MSQGFSVDHSNVSPGLGAHPSRDRSDSAKWPAGTNDQDGKQSSEESDPLTNEMQTDQSLKSELKEDKIFEDGVDYFTLGMDKNDENEEDKNMRQKKKSERIVGIPLMLLPKKKRHKSPPMNKYFNQ